jgi:8-oxo-dGTP diphosphatase
VTHQPYFCGVQCLVYESKRGPGSKKVLLGKRRRTAGEGKWALPGGHVEHGETPLDAARRELQEETGLTGVSAEIGPTYITYTTNVPYAHTPVIFREAQGELREIEDEHLSDLAFFPLTHLPEPMFDPSRMALDVVNSHSVHAIFGVAGSKFLKIDMVATDAPDRRRNAAWTAFFFVGSSRSGDGSEGATQNAERTMLIVTWGRREYAHRSVRPEEYDSLGEAVTRLEKLIQKRLSHQYYVTGLSGDIPLDRLLTLFPRAGTLRVVSDSLLRRLFEDPVFRHTLQNDSRNFMPGFEVPIEELLNPLRSEREDQYLPFEID